MTNNYVELTAELEGDRELYYPRISACFYGENDNRILPMDLKSCNKNKAIAIGIFDTPFLFYNNRKSQNVRVNFLFSDGNGESIIVKPEKIDDLTAVQMAREVSKRIENELSYPGQIRVTVIRETRAVDYAK